MKTATCGPALPIVAAERPAPSGWLRHPDDIHCLLYHVLALVAYGCAFWLYFRPDLTGVQGPWSRLAFILAAAFMLGWTSGIDVAVNFHNHAHQRMFRQPWLNRWVGRLWTFSGGWPSHFFVHAHIVVHHTHLLAAEDWTLPKRRADGTQESLIVYSLLHWPWRAAYHFWKDFTGGRAGRNGGRRALKEFVIFLALWSIPFWIDPVMALWLWVLPQWLGNVILMGGGMYAQHAGCTEPSAEHPHSHSNSSLSPLLNLTMFNLGYHLEHHEYPAAHWTSLPDIHRQLEERLQADHARVFNIGYHRIASILATPPPSGGPGSPHLVKSPAFIAEPGESFDLGAREYLKSQAHPADQGADLEAKAGGPRS